MGKTKTKNQKKSRLNAIRQGEEDFGTVPHSFVFHRGQIGKNVGQLVTDMRRVMEPFTAENLKVRKKNVLKDFAAVAGPLGVTHFMIFTKTPSSINMRLARLPKGPTMYFKLLKYTLVKDIVSSLKRHRMHQQQFTHHPLLVLNNFGSTGMQVKLMSTMFQNMFPSINVHKVNLNSIKRCVLLNYDPLSEEIEFRHYSLKVVPVGMSRGVKKLMQERFPNMSRFDDISELLMKGANLSESEAEQDGDHNITELPQAYSGRGNMSSQQSAVRLTEIGPRMTMKLVKIEEGLGGGNVLYHSLVQKSEEEIREILKRKEEQLKLKERRKKKQEQNVLEKKEKREENKKRSLAGIKRKHQEQEGATDSEVEDPGLQDSQPPAEESEDEAEYYRQAVGEEPDEDMFPAAKKRRGADRPPRPFKKRKPSAGKDSSQGGAPKPGKRTGGGPSPKRAGRAEKGRGADRPSRPFKRKPSAGKDSSQGGAPKPGKRTGGGPSPKRAGRAEKRRGADRPSRPFKKRKPSAGRDSSQGGAPKPGKRTGGGPSPKRAGRADAKGRPQSQDRKLGKKDVKRFGVKGPRGLVLNRRKGNAKPGSKRGPGAHGGKQGFKQKKGKGRP